ncbi:MAG: hypothetical protein V4710_15550 [Verrucomicrobiota bacterium]
MQELINPEPPVIGLAVTNGVAEGGKLRGNRMFQITATGIDFAGVMTKEHVVEAFRLVRRMKSLYHVCLADLIDHARTHHGDEFVAETMQQMEFDLSDATQANAIGELPRECRRAELTSAHYWVVAKAELEPDQTKHWLDVAVKEKLSPLDLTRAIAMGAVALNGTSGSGKRGGVVTIQGIRMLWDTWERQVTKSDPIEKWDEARLRRFLDEAAPMEAAISAARAKLGYGK